MRAYVTGLPAFETGAAVNAELERQGFKDLIRLNSNEGPFPPFPEALEAIQRAAQRANRYPDPTCRPLVEAIASLHDVLPENVVLGPGSTSLLFLLGVALLDEDDELVYPWPSFPQYRNVALHQRARPVAVPLDGYRVDLTRVLAALTPKARMVIVPNPNNPTGSSIAAEEVDAFVKALPVGVVAAIDEAYAEYAPGFQSGVRYVRMARPIIVLRTFSKIYGLAGARVGYGIGPADLVAGLTRLQPPFLLNELAVAAAAASLTRQDLVAERAEANAVGREQLCAGVRKLGLECAPSTTNFLLIDLGRDSDPVFSALVRQGVLVRHGRGFEYPDHLRVTVGLPHENDRFLDALAKALALS